MNETLTVALIIAAFTLFLVGLAALSEQAVQWWDDWKFSRHVKQAIALTEED